MSDTSRAAQPPFWRSRIFMLSGLVVIALTVLVALDKIDITSTALTTVFLGLIATVAGLSRRGTDFQPLYVGDRRQGGNDTARILESMTPILSPIVENVAKVSSASIPIIPPPPPPGATRMRAPMPAIIDTVGGRAVHLEHEEVPVPAHDEKVTDYIRHLNSWLMSSKIFEKQHPAELAERLSVDFTSNFPEEWSTDEIYESIMTMVHSGVLYVVPDDPITQSDSDKAETGEYRVRK